MTSPPKGPGYFSAQASEKQKQKKIQYKHLSGEKQSKKAMQESIVGQSIIPQESQSIKSRLFFTFYVFVFML